MTTQAQDTSTLIREHSDKLFRFFRSHGVSYAEAQDLTQETFRVFLEKDRSTIKSPPSFLWGIARYKLLQAKTRPRTYDEYRSSLGPEALTSLSQQVDRGLRIQVLLMQLPDERDRSIFLMRCQGLTISEIEESLAVGRATVNRSLAATRERIDELAEGRELISRSLAATRRHIDELGAADGISADDVADHFRET